MCWIFENRVAWTSYTGNLFKLRQRDFFPVSRWWSDFKTDVISHFSGEIFFYFVGIFLFSFSFTKEHCILWSCAKKQCKPKEDWDSAVTLHRHCSYYDYMNIILNLSLLFYIHLWCLRYHSIWNESSRKRFTKMACTVLDSWSGCRCKLYVEVE